jgi:hypothetical protein
MNPLVATQLSVKKHKRDCRIRVTARGKKGALSVEAMR